MPERSEKVSANALRPEHSISGYAEVVDFVRREISLGRLLPGDRLPAERKLADALGVARETLRQALRVLEGSGQIVIVRGTAGGAVIQDNSVPPEVALHELRQRREALLMLVEFRSELETAAARLSAERRSQRDLDAMRAAQQALSEAADKDESRSADTAFHLAVARAGGNMHLVSAIEDSRASMFHPVDLADYEFVKEASHSQHEVILNYIESGDAEAAAKAMRDHIEASRTEMLRLIDP